MNRGRRRSALSSPNRIALWLPSASAVLVAATCATAATCAVRAPAGTPGHVEARWRPARLAFLSTPSRLGSLRHGKGGATSTVRAVQSRSDATKEGEPRGDGIDVHDDSWYLGDGGFAERHLGDEEHIAAKKNEKDFFRKRSLSVYDQMREASMLLLAQQQILAAEETREEASKPRYVAAAGGSQAARAQAARDRQKRREAVAGLLPETTASTSGNASAAVAIPAGPGMLSGASLGVGGLDEELEEIRRRVCVPLAAPADLLVDLGISPVRGLLLHGPPGCGKTLLARQLSAALTPRPPAVVSGPEILERFVGSSEANIRALFDYPPDVPGGTDAEQAEALHVIVMDEFDSIGQRRGGGDDGGDRVRDSVVNQLLARMDGFQELDRPTLLVALTNRIDLLDTALLRPGRFEVQVQIPGPDQAGREAILRIHTQRMQQADRIDTPPPDETSSSTPAGGGSYDALMSSLASVTDGFTGAELAGLVRAAASYALERAVGGGGDGGGAAGCRVTAEDFGRGLADVTRSKPSVERPVGGGAGVWASPTSADADAAMGGEKGGAMSGASGGEAEKRAGQQGAVAKSPSAAAAAVAAARLEGGIDGSLSSEDLASVQKLLLQKMSQREDEDALLSDAASVVAQRRRSRGGEEKTKSDQQDAGGAAAGDAGKSGEERSVKRKPTVKKFKHTGWFHTLE